jgi:hypothetical protein
MLRACYNSWNAYSIQSDYYSAFYSLPEGKVNIFSVCSENPIFFVILINFPSCQTDGNGNMTQPSDGGLWHSNQTVSIILLVLLARLTCVSFWKQVAFRDYFRKPSSQIDFFLSS